MIYIELSRLVRASLNAMGFPSLAIANALFPVVITPRFRKLGPLLSDYSADTTPLCSVDLNKIPSNISAAMLTDTQSCYYLFHFLTNSALSGKLTSLTTIFQ